MTSEEAITDPVALQKRYGQLGLKAPQFAACLAEDGRFTRPWRVAAIDRGWCSLLGLAEDEDAEASRRVRTRDWSLAVGDWVVLGGAEPEPEVRERLDRTTHLRRATHGGEGQQWIAANLDTVFVVAAFGPTEKLERRGINARRIERYISAVQEGGATPVVVLNKTDVLADAQHAKTVCAELERRLNVAVVALSAAEGDHVDALAPYLTAGETVAFVGPSGVGKSTLLNTLIGRDEAETSDVRTTDMKGRHTTTRRELSRIAGGALLIDTPGMREFRVLIDDDEVAGFDDIEALARGCRFGDCGHESEPGCRVLEAVSAGDLLLDRLNNYRAIVRDGQRANTKHDAMARHEQRKAGKKFGRMVKEAKSLKKRR